MKYQILFFGSKVLSNNLNAYVMEIILVNHLVIQTQELKSLDVYETI